jgi:Right handed beta helix region
MKKPTRLFTSLPMLLLACSLPLFGQNATTPGEIITPFPTVTNLAVEWMITGDDNLNCVVAVKYRIKGSATWNSGMPLRRVPSGTNLGFTWQNKCSGSLFDLAPGTEYEINLSLNDPDGGTSEKTVTAQTRPVPRIPATAKITDIPAGTYDRLTPEDGTAESPRVYRSVNGSAVYDFVDLQNRSYVWIIGLTINSSGSNSARGIKADGAKNCVIRYCTITGLYGITAYDPGITNCYIGDNVITGKVGWTEATMGADGDNEGEGIQFTGSGNVVCYNKVKGFRDCISTMEDDGVTEQRCIDIYNNDVYTGADDGIEADFCFNNCRVMRNRITNSYVGVSSQPGLGGPNYFIRNVMYNVVHAAFKFKRDSRGDVALHNTVIKVGAGLAGNDALDFAYFRNNCAIGGPTGGVDWGGYGAGNPYAADIRDPGLHSSFDYDAVGVASGTYVAKIGGVAFSTVEPHGIGNIKLNEVFSNVAFPNPPVPERDLADLRPQPNSAVIDKGEVIPNINDSYTGAAPDCGAYEAGQAMPIYGPRPQGVDEATPVKCTDLPNRKSVSADNWTVTMDGSRMISTFNAATPGIYAFSVLDLSGKVIHVQSLRCQSGFNIEEIIVPGLRPGCYIACLHNATNRFKRFSVCKEKAY